MGTASSSSIHRWRRRHVPGLDHWVAVEPNRVDFIVGTSSDDHRLESSVRVVGERRILRPSERSFLPTVAVSTPSA